MPAPKNPRTCKYLIFATNLQPVVFGTGTEHADIAGGRAVLSAGFCKVGTERGRITVSCFGESVGLKRKSAGENDAALIELMLSEG